MSDEILDIVNERGDPIGQAPRREIHARRYLHRVVHALVFNSQGRVLLQKRSAAKDVAPGKWDTSVGGHVHPGEDIAQALRREMQEELSLDAGEPVFLYTYVHRNRQEEELVTSFRCVNDAAPVFDPEEIEDIRYWSVAEIEAQLGSGAFSDHFEDEFRRYLRHTST